MTQDIATIIMMCAVLMACMAIIGTIAIIDIAVKIGTIKDRMLRHRD